MVTVEPASRLRHFNIAALILIAAYIVGVILLAIGAVAGAALSGPLAAYGSPTDFWPILVQTLLGGAAFGAYWWPRRSETRSFVLMATVVLAVTTLALGLFGYWDCQEGQSPFWTSLAYTLQLVIGNTIEECPGPPSLALQTARLSGPLIVLIAAIGVLATLFAARLQRLRVRSSRHLIVVVGLASDTANLVRRLTITRPPRTVVAVLASGTADSRLLRSVQEAGGSVVTVHPTDERALDVLLTAGRRFKVRAAYLMSADVNLNLRWAKQLRMVGSRCTSWSTTLPARMVVRIDDPWQAESWRRNHAFQIPSAGQAGPPWICDALSCYEITAIHLVDRLQKQDHDRVVLAGASLLALAVCAELAQRGREDRLLGVLRRPALADLVLVGPEAQQLRDQHQLRQQRFGNPTSTLRILERPAAFPAFSEALTGAQQPAILLTDEENPAEVEAHGSYLAARSPHWTIFARDAGLTGIAPAPIMEQLFPYGLTTQVPAEWPVDNWERAARMVHEQYRQSRDLTAPARPADRSWNEGLDPFLKESNIRLVTTTLGSMEQLDRTWGSTLPPAEGAVDHGLTPEELTTLAELEHESWRRHLLEHRWRPGSPRDDRRRVHPALRPWSELDASNRDATRANVADAIETLSILGYRSAPKAAAASGWRRLARSGEVTAVRSDAPWSWRTGTGEWLNAAAGDWRVREGEAEWSVADSIFGQTYEQVAGDRWRRIGEVDGRPAVAGEIVRSLEGAQTARAGDWVLRGGAGEEWIVSAEHLAAHYQPL
jgi:hypothetical protein